MQLVIGAATWAASALGASAATAATVGTVVGWAAAAAYVGYALFGQSRNRQSQEGPRLGDLSVQSSARGAPLARVWGSLRVSGNLIDGQKYEEKQEQEVGGKGFGGGGGTQISYHYFADFAVTLCEGPIVAVRRIWLNNKLWYDVSETASAKTLAASAERTQYFKLYTGTATQNPDPTLEAIHGVGTVPPYRHTAYLIFKRLGLANYGNGIPNVSVEVITAGAATPPAWSTVGGGSVGTYSTALARVPDTGRIFIPGGTLNNTIYVYDGQLNSLASITLAADIDAANLTYVTTTRRIWASTVEADPMAHTIRIIDADTYTVTQTLTVTDSNLLGDHFILYNPSLDRVYLFCWLSVQGTKALTFTSAGYQLSGFADSPFAVNTSTVDIEYLEGADKIVFVGFSGGLRFYSSTSELSITTLTPGGGFGETGDSRIAYDQATETLWWADKDSTTIYPIDVSVPVPVLPSARTLPFAPTGGIVYASGSLWILNNPNLYRVSPATLAVTETIVLHSGGLPTSAFGAPVDGVGFLFFNDKHKVPFASVYSNAGVPLSTIVTDLCVEAGLSAADIDVTALTDTVHGYVRAGPMETAQALQPLLAGFLFDAQESDYLLKFPKRGGASVATVLEDDLAAHEPGEDLPAPLRIARAQETELPQAISIHYMDPAKDYQQGAQHDTRVITSARHTVQLDLPIAMSATSARRLARILMDNAWVERHRYECAIPIDYLKLDPADVVTVKAHATSHLLRLTRTDFGTPGILRCEGVAERVATLPPLESEPAVTTAAPIYTADDTAPPDTFPGQTLLPLAVTRLALMDIPILRDLDNDPGYYYALAPYSTGDDWPGAVLYKSTDGGASYAVLDGMTSAAALGSATTALATGPATIWDNGNSVTVRLNYGSLASDTELNVFAGNNAAALGAHGRWEIIQWQTAALNGDGTYTLSKLLRGRKGTEHAVTSHAIGDTFVALTAATIDRVSTGSAELTLGRHYKAVTIGGSLQEATAQAFTNTGVGLECYSPVNIKGTRVASGDITITWIRRTRASGEWRDLVDVILFEDSEKYDLEILNGSTVVRTWTDLTVASQVYTSAQQVTDWGSNQSAVSVRAYQKSAVVARGYPGAATV